MEEPDRNHQGQHGRGHDRDAAATFCYPRMGDS